MKTLVNSSNLEIEALFTFNQKLVSISIPPYAKIELDDNYTLVKEIEGLFWEGEYIPYETLHFPKFLDALVGVPLDVEENTIVSTDDGFILLVNSGSGNIVCKSGVKLLLYKGSLTDLQRAEMFAQVAITANPASYSYSSIAEFEAAEIPSWFSMITVLDGDTLYFLVKEEGGPWTSADGSDWKLVTVPLASITPSASDVITLSGQTVQYYITDWINTKPNIVLPSSAVTFSNVIEFSLSPLSNQDASVPRGLVRKSQVESMISNSLLTFNNVDGLQAALNSKANVSHVHDIANIVNLQTSLDSKSNTGHIHTSADITDFVSQMALKSNVGHGHPIADITNLQSSLDAKSPLASPTFTGLALINNTTALSLTSTTHGFQIGAYSGANLAFSNTSMQGRNNGVSAAININSLGGNITIGASDSSLTNIRNSLQLKGTTVSATAAEINYLVGVTSGIQTQINTKSNSASPTFTGVVTVPTLKLTSTSVITLASTDNASQIGADASNNLVFSTTAIQSRNNGVAASLNLNSLGGNIGLGSGASTVTIAGTLVLGSTTISATPAEINYLVGVTSEIQTQINTKAPIVSPSFSSGVKLQGAELAAIGTTGIDLQVGPDTQHLAITRTKIQGRSNSGTFAASNIEINTLGGSTTIGSAGNNVTIAGTLVLGATTVSATATEINYLVGVTSGIQTQINTKSNSASPTFTGTTIISNTNAIALATNTNALILGSNATFNLALGNTSVQARNNGVSATLNLNELGGNITIGASDSSLTNIRNSLQLKGTTVSATAAEINYLVGVTSGIQTQINGKLDSNANAVSATVLQTARTINGVSFNGSANISIAASAIPSTATGDVSATNVQAAIAELATEKAALAGATFTGKVITPASATGGAGINLPHGAAPTTPVNGDIWTTTSGVFARVNAATRTIAFLEGATFTGAISAPSLTLTTDLAIAHGGTGASDAATARSNLGITATNIPSTATGDVSATDVQAAIAELATDKAALAGATFTGAISATNFSGSSSGVNTGDQTTITGNAGSATVLQTARNINGIPFNGSADISISATNIPSTATGDVSATNVQAAIAELDTEKAALAGATFTGKIITPASVTGAAGLNIPHGVTPTTLSNGDIWTTTTGIFARMNGSTRTVAFLEGATFTGAISAVSLTLTTDLAIAHGGTGASDAATARTNLGITAANVPLTPAGSIIATDVQSAIAELDTEKAALAGATFTGAISATNFSGSSSGVNTGDQTTITGNAGSATVLQTARNINGIPFNGSADISISASAIPSTATGDVSATTVQAAIAELATDKAAKAGATFTGKITAVASATGGAGFNLPQGAAPTAPVNGDIWTNSTGIFARINAATRTVAFLEGATFTGAISATNFSGSSSGVNTGDQTTITGNAGSATVLQTARNINGIPFNGSADISISASAIPFTATGDISATNVQSAIAELDIDKAALAGATFTGKVVTPASATGNAGINLPHGAAPTSPANGDIWTTTAGIFARINAATRTVATLEGATFTGAISAPSLTLTTDLAIAHGGTGASDAATARTNLGITAANIPSTATGDVSATNVQSAIAELDTEKAALAGATFTGGITLNSTLNVIGSTTLGTVDTGSLNASSLTVSNDASVLGNLVAAKGFELGNLGGGCYKDFETILKFGASPANTWKTIITGSIVSGTYSNIGFKITIFNPKATNANSTTLDIATEEIYYAYMVRSLAVSDDTDACYVRGPGNAVRAVKTSLGNYEIQVQNDSVNRAFRINIQVISGGRNNHTITYYGDTGATANTGTAQYNASTSTGLTQFFNIVSAVDYNTTSDINVKENVHVITNAIEKVKEICGVTFNFINSEKKRAGVIAQDVEKVLPEAVTEYNGIKQVAYGNLIGLLIQAFKEQQEKIEALESMILSK